MNIANYLLGGNWSGYRIGWIFTKIMRWSFIKSCILQTVVLNVAIISVVDADPLVEQRQRRGGFPVLDFFHLQCFTKAEFSEITHLEELYNTSNGTCSGN